MLRKVLFMLAFLAVASIIYAQGIEGSESSDSILKNPEFYENFGGISALQAQMGKLFHWKISGTN